jgi:hypothetical protein
MLWHQYCHVDIRMIFTFNIILHTYTEQPQSLTVGMIKAINSPISLADIGMDRVPNNAERMNPYE